MNKTLLEELKEARVSNEPAYVCFFNTGKVSVEERSSDQRMNEFEQDDTIRSFKYLFKAAAESYARRYKYDSISMNIEAGLIYKIEDVDQENNVREDAEPLNGIVRCYTGKITSYENGKKTNVDDYYGYGKQGFIDYNRLVSEMKNNGLTFNGPETFEEFKEIIKSGVLFNISLVADLNKKEEVKEEPKKLIKNPFFRRNK